MMGLIRTVMVRSSAKNKQQKDISKNRRERRQLRSRSAVVHAYDEHRRPQLQRAAGLSRCHKRHAQVFGGALIKAR
jgi:hypothetical protein